LIVSSALQERLFAWLGGLRASNTCGGLLSKLSEHGMANQQRMKLEALRVLHVDPSHPSLKALHQHCSCHQLSAPAGALEGLQS